MYCLSSVNASATRLCFALGLVGLAAVLKPQTASASDCSLFSSYQALVAAGTCTIGSGATQLTFSNFMFTGASTGTGITPTDMGISVLNGAPATPPSTDALYGFDFNPNLTVSGVGSESIHITYSITAPSAIIASLHLLVNEVAINGATATVTENDTCPCAA